jgi:hypothetical protein
MKWPAPSPEVSSGVLSLTLSTVLARLFHPVHRQVLRLLRHTIPATQYASRQTVTVLPFAYLVFVAVTAAEESCLSPPWSGCRGARTPTIAGHGRGAPAHRQGGKAVSGVLLSSVSGQEYL